MPIQKLAGGTARVFSQTSAPSMDESPKFKAHPRPYAVAFTVYGKWLFYSGSYQHSYISVLPLW